MADIDYRPIIGESLISTTILETGHSFNIYPVHCKQVPNPLYAPPNSASYAWWDGKWLVPFLL